MSILWAIIGIVLTVVMGVAGLIFGDLDRVEKDPEVKAKIEEQKRELERQRAWKAKRDGK